MTWGFGRVHLFDLCDRTGGRQRGGTGDWVRDIGGSLDDEGRGEAAREVFGAYAAVTILRAQVY